MTPTPRLPPIGVQPTACCETDICGETRKLQERLADLEQKQKHIEYYQKKLEDMQLDYTARLKALGMSDEDIAEFEAFWKAEPRPVPPTEGRDPQP